MSTDYDYKIEAIEQFLDTVYERDLKFATESINGFYEDATKLDTTQYPKVEHEISVLQNEKEKVDSACYKARCENWDKLYDADYRAIWAEYKANSPENAHAMECEFYEYLLPEDKKEACQKIHKQHKKDLKDIEAPFKEQMKNIRAQIKSMKEFKVKIRDQRLQRQAFYKLHPVAKLFDVKEVLKLGVEESAKEWAKRDRDVIRRDIYSRSESYVGKLTTMDYIHFGDNGSLNGIVTGETGKRASVRTIIAGGYNIQKEHYRVIIHLIKEKETNANNTTADATAQNS